MFLFSVPAEHQRHGRLGVGEEVTPPPHLDSDLRRVLFLFTFDHRHHSLLFRVFFAFSSKT